MRAASEANGCSRSRSCNVSLDLLLNVIVGILPVIAFLAALLYLDSYKLIRLRTVLAVVAAGVVVAYACYVANAWLIGILALDFTPFSRYVGPFVEEFGKALVVVALIRAHRVGFLVDAAIAGFAVGTGFAIVENIYYQHLVPDAGLGTWIVRGFGTAIMHGGATALFAVIGLTLLEEAERNSVLPLLPGFALAAALHSTFNHLSSSPRLATLAM